MILTCVASSIILGCGGGNTPASDAPAGATTGEVLDGSTTTRPTNSTELIPMVCQDTREALNDWSAVDLEFSESTGQVIELTLDLSIDVGQGVTENIPRLVDQLNAANEAALTLSEEYIAKLDAFNASFELCVPLFEALPQACSDEMRQYPQVTLARSQKFEAQATLLRSSVAVGEALIAGDDGAVDVAIEQVVAASDQLAVARANLNEVVVPPFNAAIEACNAAIS
jgi:hypothetical protein